MKKHLTIVLRLLLVAVPLAINAQTSSGSNSPTLNDTAYGPRAGEHEFTLSGSGSSDKRLHHSAGGADISLGNFLSDTAEVSIRQSVSYGTGSSFSTRVAFDEHFGTGQLRPFLGANLGYVYGNAVKDTLAAGLEGGVKYYVMPKTFIFALVDYSFLFRSSNQIRDRFDNGAFFWNVGIGFQF